MGTNEPKRRRVAARRGAVKAKARSKAKARGPTLHERIDAMSQKIDNQLRASQIAFDQLQSRVATGDMLRASATSRLNALIGDAQSLRSWVDARLYGMPSSGDLARLARRVEELVDRMSAIVAEQVRAAAERSRIESKSIERASAMVVAVGRDLEARLSGVQSIAEKARHHLSALNRRISRAHDRINLHDAALGAVANSLRERIEEIAGFVGYNFEITEALTAKEESEAHEVPVHASDSSGEEFYVLSNRARLRVIQDVLAERIRQDEQWGGPRHAPEFAAWEWRHFIEFELSKFTDSPDAARLRGRERLVKIAALAFAAIESIDRKEAADRAVTDEVYGGISARSATEATR